MIREKGLSPRQTQVRLKPLLFLRPRPLKGGDPIRETPRFCTQYEYPFFDARLEGCRGSVRPRRMLSNPTARLQRKSTVSGSNGLRPSFAGSPPFKILDRVPRSCPSPFCAVLETQTHVSVLERKIAPRSLFLS